VSPLKTGRHHQQTRAITLQRALGRGGVNAVHPHWNADHAGIGAAEDRDEAGVDRVLQQNGFAVAHEHALQQVEALLAATGDEDVVAVADGSLFAAAFEQVAAERSVAGRRAALQDA